MKKETITIIIGTVTTLLVLAIAIFAMYKIDEKKTSTPKDKPTIKEEDKNNSNDKDSSITNNENNIGDKNNNSNNSSNENSNNVKNKVTLYIFHGSTCSACKTALKRINTNLVGKYDYLEIKTFEVWGNKANSELMSKVATELNIEAKYIPFIVIDKYNTTGSTNDKDFLVDEINKAHKNNNYLDVVEKVLNENKDLKPTFEILKK